MIGDERRGHGVEGGEDGGEGDGKEAGHHQALEAGGHLLEDELREDFRAVGDWIGRRGDEVGTLVHDGRSRPMMRKMKTTGTVMSWEMTTDCAPWRAFCRRACGRRGPDRCRGPRGSGA